MTLRNYHPNDCPILAELFFQTVHTVNAKDYTQQQLDVWATGQVDLSLWNTSFLDSYTLIAENEKCITGFGNMDSGGYLDMLYVHKDYQGNGIATAIVAKLEEQLSKSGISHFTTYASITARPFFEQNGYCIVRENTVIKQNIKLTNFLMEKMKMY